jgi:hypothetical protein
VSWCIGSDFNVRYLCERSGNSRQSPAMLHSSEFNFYHGLMDIPLVGGNLCGLIIKILNISKDLCGLVFLSLLWCLWWYVDYVGQKNCRED